MSRNIIRDGYTRRGFIEAEDRLYDYLSFEYRPMLAEVVEMVEEASQRQETVKEGVRVVAAATAEHLVSWSEVEKDGEKVPHSVEEVRRLPFSMLNKLYRIVAGITPTDPIPDSTPKDSALFVQDIIAKASGEGPGAKAAAASEKN